jgi:hypothetical protein
MRFYFDFLSHNNDEIRDCEGVELANWLAAHRHAIRIVQQTVPFIPAGPDWGGWRIQVRDESRRQVLSVLFHAPSRHAVPGRTQTCLQTNVPDLTALFRRGGEAGWRPEPSLRAVTDRQIAGRLRMGGTRTAAPERVS